MSLKVSIHATKCNTMWYDFISSGDIPEWLEENPRSSSFFKSFSVLRVNTNLKHLMTSTPGFSTSYNLKHLKLSVFVSRGRLTVNQRQTNHVKNHVFVKGLNVTCSATWSQFTGKKSYRKNVVTSQAVITLKIYPVLLNFTGLCFRTD